MGRYAYRVAASVMMAGLLVAAADPAIATTFSVDSAADEPDKDTGDNLCLSIPSQRCTLRAAIQQLHKFGGGPHQILLRNETYNVGIGATAGQGEDAGFRGDFDLCTSDAPPVYIEIFGTGPTTIIQPDPANNLFERDRLFDVLKPECHLSLYKLWLQNGRAFFGQNGGCIQNRGTLDLSDVTLFKCSAAPANGNDAGGDGGGVYSSNGSQVNIDRSTFSSNFSGFGNNQGGQGGGLAFIVDNFGIARITNSTFSENTAENFGGGIFWSSGGGRGGQLSMRLANVTITRNVANNLTGSSSSGGIFSGSPGSSVDTIHTIVSNNTAGGVAHQNCGGPLIPVVNSHGFNLESGDRKCFSQATDLVDSTPLDALSDNGGYTLTHALPVGHKAIDNGDPRGCVRADFVTPLEIDQRFAVRPADGDANGSFICDIGAYEVECAQNLFRSQDVPIRIKDLESGASTLMVPASTGTIVDVDLVQLDLFHRTPGDLKIELVSPLGTTALLVDQACGDKPDFRDVTLDDDGTAGAIGSQCPPTPGASYKPNAEGLNRFNGENAGGTWTLKITDVNGNQLEGILMAWGLRIRGICPNGTPTPTPRAPTSTPTSTPVPPTSTPTRTNTPVPATSTTTRTNTPIPPTSTSTRTNTPIPPTSTSTPTSTPLPPTSTTTRTNTPVPSTSTATRTNTPVPPTSTATPTSTPLPPTSTTTRTNTPVPSTSTATRTNTPVPSTSTSTATSTPVPPTSTATRTVTATPVPTDTATGTPTETATSTETPTGTATETATTTDTVTGTATASSTSTATASATLTPPATASASATATATQLPATVHFVERTVDAGKVVHGNGNLPAGDYDLCVVPNGSYPVGSDYTGQRVNCVAKTVARGAFAPIVVWTSAVAGNYDLLAFHTGQATIVAGDNTGAVEGLTVVSVMASRSGVGTALVLFLLGALGLQLTRSRRRATGRSL